MYASVVCLCLYLCVFVCACACVNIYVCPCSGIYGAQSILWYTAQHLTCAIWPGHMSLIHSTTWTATHTEKIKLHSSCLFHCSVLFRCLCQSNLWATMKWKLAISIQFVPYWTNGQRKSPPTSPVRVKSFFFLLTKPLGVEKSSVFFVYVYCPIVGECLKSYGVLFVCGELVSHQLIVYELFAEIFARFILCGVNVTRMVHPGWQSMFTIAFYDQRTVVRSAWVVACISYFMWVGRLMINMAQ